MIPILYSANETDFQTRGLGPLYEATECFVTEELNGEYELEMTFPVTGRHYNEITDRCIVMAKPSPYREAQPFRVYEIEAPLNGLVTIRARHVSYDLSERVVAPFTVTGGARAAFDGMVSHLTGTTDFTIDTDLNAHKRFVVSVPSTFRSLLGSGEGSLLDLWKGEFEFDRWVVRYKSSRGSLKNVRIAYGLNMTDFKMTKNLDAFIKSIYPYWTNGEETVTVPTGTVPVVSTAAYGKSIPVDLSSEFNSKPTPSELYDKAEEYIESNDLSTPKVTFEVSFLDLASTQEYEVIASLERVDLGDTVIVVFPLYDIESAAKVVGIKTDVLLERYESVTIGTARANIADTISSLKGGSSSTYIGGGSVGTVNYNELINKPSINSIVLTGNKTLEELGAITSYSDLSNKPKINGVTLSGNKTLSDLGIQTFSAGTGIDYTNNVLSIKDLYINCGTSQTVMED